MKGIDIEEFVYANRISKKDLAEYIGVSPSYVSQIISGERALSAERLQKLLEHPTWNITPLLKDVRYQADMSTAPPLPDGTTYTPPPPKSKEPPTEERLLKEIEQLIAINRQQTQSIAELIAQQGQLIEMLKKEK